MLKKIMVLTAAVASLGSVAFAETFNCDLPKDANGHAIYGGPGYSIESDQNKVTLIESRISFHPGGPQRIPMKLVHAFTEGGGIYSAKNVKATIMMGGIAGGTVSLAVRVGNKDFYSVCRSELD